CTVSSWLSYSEALARLISGAVNDADLITDYRFSSIDLGNKADRSCSFPIAEHRGCNSQKLTHLLDSFCSIYS
ncbi:hypothetical protein J9B53_29175, partial [Klebsiella pneumoniae]